MALLSAVDRADVVVVAGTEEVNRGAGEVVGVDGSVTVRVSCGRGRGGGVIFPFRNRAIPTAKQSATCRSLLLPRVPSALAPKATKIANKKMSRATYGWV